MALSNGIFFKVIIAYLKPAYMLARMHGGSTEIHLAAVC